MRGRNQILGTLPPKAARAVMEIARGMKLEKCRKCGCMKDALDQTERTFAASEEPEVRSLGPIISSYQAKMKPLAYDCIGCKKCWGADATIALAEHFDEIEIDQCAVEDNCACRLSSMAPAAFQLYQSKSTTAPWPPHPGDYVLGDPEGTVAVCPLSNRDLPHQLITASQSALAIAGRCDTENIGIEKVVLNLLANPRIRWLVICGQDAKGHRAGDAFLRLKERGVDANMRVLESASWRPVLKNLTLLQVARFREKVEEINLIGATQLDRILAAIRECSVKPAPVASFTLPEADSSYDPLAGVEYIPAKAPKQLHLDRAGFFIILPQPQKSLIVCEHYENNGRLVHVIQGQQADIIAATAVERGFVTQLDHAAYLGRELQKAEAALSGEATYEQDAALGELSRSQEEDQGTKTNGSRCTNNPTCPADDMPSSESTA
jgi:tetrahydromethanopterin S-methyltransferase subunit A